MGAIMSSKLLVTRFYDVNFFSDCEVGGLVGRRVMPVFDRMMLIFDNIQWQKFSITSVLRIGHFV